MNDCTDNYFDATPKTYEKFIGTLCIMDFMQGTSVYRPVEMEVARTYPLQERKYTVTDDNKFRLESIIKLLDSDGNLPAFSKSGKAVIYRDARSIANAISKIDGMLWVEYYHVKSAKSVIRDRRKNGE